MPSKQWLAQRYGIFAPVRLGPDGIGGALPDASPAGLVTAGRQAGGQGKTQQKARGVGKHDRPAILNMAFKLGGIMPVSTKEYSSKTEQN